MLNNKQIQNFQSKILFIFIVLTCIVYSKDTNNASHKISVIIPKIALLDIESATSTDVSLKLTSPSESGNSLVGANDKSIWLNITSIVKSGNLRDVTVKLNKPIPGIDISVVSDTYSGSGYGEWGTPLPKIILSDYDQTLISGIKSGTTGDGTYNGFNLEYSAHITESNYEMINSLESKDITVTYTLTH